jgi:cytochrome c biogenesis protein CcdA
MTETTEQAEDKSAKGPLTAIGIFLSVFGIAVISGIFFTHTLHGKVINLICGGLLLTIGIIAIYNDQLKNKSGKTDQ